MKLSCDIIRDLLPLYAEELASADSREAVEGHLLGCESCRKAYEDMKTCPVIIPEEPGLDTVRRGLWRRRLLTALCAVLIVCMAGCWFLSWLTAPIYLDKSIITDIQDNHDGTVTISMDAAAVGRQTFQLEIDPTDAGETIVLWTSRWLEWTWSEPIPRPLSITRSVIHNGIYLCTGTGEDELIYENPQKFINGGVVLLPRLYLSFYFQMSLLIGSAALLLSFLLRKRRAGKWLVCIGSLLVCYALCQGIVCGFTFASFFAEQELCWALAMALCLWGALMCMRAMRKKP
jgi:hypothetical protein